MLRVQRHIKCSRPQNVPTRGLGCYVHTHTNARTMQNAREKGLEEDGFMDCSCVIPF